MSIKRPAVSAAKKPAKIYVAPRERTLEYYLQELLDRNITIPDLPSHWSRPEVLHVPAGYFVAQFTYDPVSHPQLLRWTFELGALAAPFRRREEVSLKYHPLWERCAWAVWSDPRAMAIARLNSLLKHKP